MLCRRAVAASRRAHDLGQVLLEQLRGECVEDGIQRRVDGQQEDGHPRIKIVVDGHSCVKKTRKTTNANEKRIRSCYVTINLKQKG